MDDHDIVPRYHAGSQIRRYVGQQLKVALGIKQIQQRQLETIRVLPDYGADPFARYLRQTDIGYEDMYNWPLG